MYSIRNYYMGTKANWTKAEAPKRGADYTSHSGSEYWYTNKGVYRMSDHWGYGIASCDWFIDGQGEYDSSWMDDSGERCGFCPWGGFTAKDYTACFYGVPEEAATGHDCEGRPFAVVAVDDESAADGWVCAFGARIMFSPYWFMYTDL